MRFRYRTPIRKGLWLSTNEDARKAAVKAEVAHQDEDGVIFLDALTEIESDDGGGM